MSLVLVNETQLKALPVSAVACGVGTVRMLQSVLRLAFVIVWCGDRSNAAVVLRLAFVIVWCGAVRMLQSYCV